MRVVGFAVLLMSVFLGNAFAQVPKGNVFIGYSYMSADVPNTAARQNLNGWEGSLEGKVLPFLSIVADGSGHYGTTQFFTCPLPGVTARAAIASVEKHDEPRFHRPSRRGHRRDRCAGGGGCAGAVNGNLYTALFGPRVSASFGRLRPFAHVLTGAADVSGSSSDFSLASAFGGGVDFKIAPILGWRFQGDYIHTHFSGQPEGHAHISTGVVLRF